MNTQTLAAHSDQPCRSSKLEGVPVIHRGRKVARVVGLVYDHAGQRVRGFSVQVSRRSQLRTLWWYGVQALTQKCLLLNDQVDLDVLCHPSGQWRRVPSPTVRIASVRGKVSIHDTWVDLQAGRIVAHELSLQPEQANAVATTRVAVEQLTWRADHYTLGAFPRIPMTLAPYLVMDESAEGSVNVCVS